MADDSLTLSDAQLQAERWLSVVGFEAHYEVSDFGRVRSLDRITFQRVGRGEDPDFLVPRRRMGMILSPGKSSNGYLSVNLFKRSILVQYLVSAAFIGPRPSGHLVLHNDGNRERNWATNLRYGTHKDNSLDAVLHGTRTIGEAYASAKLTDKTAAAARALRGKFSQSEIADMLNVSPAAIQAVMDRRTWKHVPDITENAARVLLSAYGHSVAPTDIAPLRDVI